MRRTLCLACLAALLLVGLVMPVGARGYTKPLVPPVEQPEGTIRLTGEFFSWRVSVWELYNYGDWDLLIDYYALVDGVYRKVELGPVNIYREGGHFYYWLDVLPDDPSTERLEGPTPLGEGANFVYKWAFLVTASPDLGKRDPALKYTPDPDPQGPLPRVVVQDIHILFGAR